MSFFKLITPRFQTGTVTLGPDMDMQSGRHFGHLH